MRYLLLAAILVFAAACSESESAKKNRYLADRAQCGKQILAVREKSMAGIMEKRKTSLDTAEFMLFLYNSITHDELVTQCMERKLWINGQFN